MDRPAGCASYARQPRKRLRSFEACVDGGRADYPALYGRSLGKVREAKTAPIDLSLTFLETLHKRWVVVLRDLKAPDYTRTFVHPDLGAMTLEKQTALYSWHGLHHVAHITS